MERDIELNQLGQFCGTTQYHNIGMGANGTDGVAYIMQNGYAWLVSDALAVIKLKLKNEPFITVELKIKEKEEAEMILTDGNNNVLYRQQYKYTDAKTDVKLYFTDNVMMLTSEY